MAAKLKAGRPSRRKSKVIYVSLEQDLAARVLEDAKLDDRTISSQVERIIKNHYGESAKASL